MGGAEEEDVSLMWSWSWCRVRFVRKKIQAQIILESPEHHATPDPPEDFMAVVVRRTALQSGTNRMAASRYLSSPSASPAARGRPRGGVIAPCGEAT